MAKADSKSKQFSGLLVLLLATSLLTACGFTLQGRESASIPAELQPLYLQSPPANAEFNRQLQRSLSAGGTQLAGSASAASHSLRLEREQQQEQVVSIATDGRAGEYELSLSLAYQVLDSAGQTRSGPQRASTSRVYFADPGNPAAKRSEAELLLTEMRQAIILQITDHLRAL